MIVGQNLAKKVVSISFLINIGEEMSLPGFRSYFLPDFPSNRLFSDYLRIYMRDLHET